MPTLFHNERNDCALQDQRIWAECKQLFVLKPLERYFFQYFQECLYPFILL